MRISIHSMLLAAIVLGAAATASGCAGRNLHEAICYPEPTSLAITLPVPASAEAVDGGELVGLQYTVQPHGTLQLFLTREHEYQDIGVEVVEARPDEIPQPLEPFQGLRIVDVLAGSTAQQAGLLPGDIIASLDGEPMSKAQRFNHMVRVHSRVEPALLKLVRLGRQNSEPLEVSVDIGVRSEHKERYESFNIPVTEELEHSGFVLGAVTHPVSRYLPAAVRDGVLVLNLQAGSPASRAGLRVGDIITSIDEVDVDGVSDVVARIERAASQGDELEVTARRGSSTVNGSFTPAASLPGTASLTIPFVAAYEHDPHHTKCQVVNALFRGILVDYEHRSCFDSEGEPFEEWGYGMFLDLIYFEKTRDKRYVSLLWFIRWSW